MLDFLHKRMRRAASQLRDRDATPWVAGALTGFGAVMLLSWFLRAEQILRVDAAFPPMQPGAALGFLLFGLGLMAHMRRARWLRLCGSLLTALSLLTLSQYVAGLDLRVVDFSLPPPPAYSRAPFTMFPFVGMAFFMAGLSLCLMSTVSRVRQRLLLLGFLGSTIATIGVLGLLGYATGLRTMPGWSAVLEMALPTGFGLVLAGAGVLLAAWREGKAHNMETTPWPAAVVAVIMATLCLWQVLRVSQVAEVERTLRAEVVSSQYKIRTHVNTLLLALARMGNEWEDFGAPARVRWEYDARLDMRSYPGYRAIAWVDAQRRIRWVAPPSENAARLKQFLSASSQRWQTLETARSSGRLRLSPAFDVPDGGAGFFAALPLQRSGRFDGFIVGFFETGELIDAAFGKEPAPLAVRVAENGIELYAKGDRQHEPVWGQQETLSFYGTTWQVEVWPTDDQLEKWNTPLPMMVLVIGLLLAGLLGLAFYLAQMARLRAEELERNNRQLMTEVTERMQTEQALERAQAQLEQRVQERPAELANINALLQRAIEEHQRIEHELKIAQTDLERRVEERTAVLGRTNQELRSEIQERERTEQSLLRMHKELEHSHDELQAAHFRLMQAEKMDSVGRLAAGVAHEVKNPLAVLLMGVEYLTKHAGANGNGLKSILEDMREAVDRANLAVRGLLDFSVPKELQPKDEQLNDIIKQALSLVKHELSVCHVTAMPGLARALPLLRLDRNKMVQVFVNLFMNAIQAMPKGGTLTVRTSTKPMSDLVQTPDGRSNQLLQETLVLAEIEDTGSGISEEQLEKIFEPFFTTKHPAHGTGLGLTVTKEIMHLHGGAITIKNRPEGGVRVSLMFELPPIAPPAAVSKPRRKAAKAA